MATNIGEILQKAALFGVGGWVVENSLCRADSYSPLFGGAKVPFLPIYAVNGLALTAMEPYISKWPTFARGLAYGAAGSLVEYAGCWVLKRQWLGQQSYRAALAQSFQGNDALARLTDGCVDFTRGLMWAGMGLVAEKV
jgi:hypothetical protein